MQQIQKLYKLDLSLYEDEGRVFIVKADSDEGRILGGESYPKDEAKRIAQVYLEKYDSSLIKQLPGETFYNLIQYMHYKDIIRLCSTSKLYQQYCDNNEVWLYLLKRDFSPLLPEDIRKLKEQVISPYTLYYTIQTVDIEQAIRFYKKYGELALIQLCKRKRENYYGARYLIDVMDIKIDTTNNSGYSAFKEEQERFTHKNILRLLIERGEVPSDMTLRNAIVAGELDLVKFLINHGVVVSVNAEDTEGMDEEERNWYLSNEVYYAAKSGHEDIVDFFMENYNMNAQQILYGAFVRGDLKFIKSIINKYGAVPDGECLLEASLHGHLEAVKFAVNKYQVDVNSENPNGITPLFRAASGGHRKILAYLLSKGADIHHRDNDEKTVVDMAMHHHDIPTIEFLYTRGAPVEDSDRITEIALENNAHDFLKRFLKSNVFDTSTLSSSAAKKIVKLYAEGKI